MATQELHISLQIDCDVYGEKKFVEIAQELQRLIDQNRIGLTLQGMHLDTYPDLDCDEIEDGEEWKYGL